MCMPGMFSIPVLPVDGEAAGAEGCDGMCVPFMFMPCISVFFGARRALGFRRTLVLAFVLALRFDLAFAFGFDMSMPGMSCML
jgi:hypothetical protein